MYKVHDTPPTIAAREVKHLLPDVHASLEVTARHITKWRVYTLAYDCIVSPYTATMRDNGAFDPGCIANWTIIHRRGDVAAL